MMVGEDWLLRKGNGFPGRYAGQSLSGQAPTVVPDMNNPYLLKLLSWADDFRKLGVWANADYPADAQRAREYGAEGIGLCRTEHMFFEAERMPVVQKMIMAKHSVDRKDALDQLLPLTTR